MAGEVEECITLQAESLPSGSISFGRFELESLSWERRSSFSHNRYLEEVEKYSTPGSVTKKKAYFEAHFKKKALLHQVSVENQKETETRHADSITGDNDGIMEDFICHGNSELVEASWDEGDAPVVSDEHEAVELQEEMSLAELNTGFPSFISEKYAELFNEPLTSDGALQSQAGDNALQLDEDSLCGIVEDKILNDNVNSKKLAENVDAASSKIPKTKKKNESIQMKTRKVSMKTSDTVEQKPGKTQFRTHLPTQQMLKKPSRNSNSISYERLKKVVKQNTPAKPEKQIPSKVSSPASTEIGNFKIMASKNMKAKASSEVKSEEGARAKKAELKPRPIERRGSDMRQPMNRVKLVSKAEEKQTYAVFNFKSSERAEKRKEYYLKLEERLHFKEAEMNEIQARTEEVKEAEMKQFRKSLNFKATPMPSFYHETASKISEGKKTSTILAKSPITRSKCSTPPGQPSHEKSLASPKSNQEDPLFCESRGSTQPVSPSVYSAAATAADDYSLAANINNKAEVIESSNYSAKRSDGLKGEEKSKYNASQNQGNGMRKRGESESRIGSGVVGKVKGIVGGNVAVHVAS